MDAIWGPATPAYERVLEARDRMWSCLTPSGYMTLVKRAVSAFEDAIREEDVFVRYELRACTAHPFRRHTDGELEQALQSPPVDIFQRAEKGYPVAYLQLRASDKKRALGRMHMLEKKKILLSLVLLSYNVAALPSDSCRKAYLTVFLAMHMHIDWIQKAFQILLLHSITHKNRGFLVILGSLFQAAADIGTVVAAPPEWKTHSCFRYGASDYTRQRMDSRSPALLCVRSDNACRRALLCWLWAPLPVARDIKMLVAKHYLWNTRCDVDVWVREEEDERAAAAKRLKA